MNKKTQCYGVIAAAGSATRYQETGGKENKLLVPLQGRALIEWSLQAFEDAPDIKGYVVVVSAWEEPRFRKLLTLERFPKLLAIIPGGANRQDSVYRALSYLFDRQETFVNDLVLVHDGARPLLTPEMITTMICELRTEPCGVGYARPLNDTLRSIRPEFDDAKLLARDRYVLMQTPQGAPLGPLMAASRLATERGEELTDELQLLEAVGYPVRIMEGPVSNIKVTFEGDVALCDYYITRRLKS